MIGGSFWSMLLGSMLINVAVITGIVLLVIWGVHRFHHQSSEIDSSDEP